MIEFSTWDEVQKIIDSCANCKSVGADLIINSETRPVRPPAPRRGEFLFISEAPTRKGGFYSLRCFKDDSPVRDDLRAKLFEILKNSGQSLPDPHSVTAIEAFVSKGFFLIHTIKWPLKESARQLRRKERLLIEHSVDCHIRQEIRLISPSVIVPLGKVACYACSHLLRDGEFNFNAGTRLMQVRGKKFQGRLDHGTVQLFPTGLPVQRVNKDLPSISDEIGRALSYFEEHG